MKDILTIHVLQVAMKSPYTAKRGANPTERRLAMCDQGADFSAEEIDVRSLIPAQRHEKIFQRIDNGPSTQLLNRVMSHTTAWLAPRRPPLARAWVRSIRSIWDALLACDSPA